MRSQRFKLVTAAAGTLAMSIMLAACGGGGGSGNNATSSNANAATNGNSSAATTNTTSATGSTTSTPVADGLLHAACKNCGSTDDQTYSGGGTGIWQALNASAQNDVLKITLKNVIGRNITLVFTNEGTDQTMPTVPVSETMSTTSSTVSVRNTMQGSSRSQTANESAEMTAIHDFNRSGWTALTTRDASGAGNLDARSTAHAATTPNVVGTTTRSFYLADGTNRSTTLEGTQTTSDGTVVNVWVETTEYSASKVSPAIVKLLLQGYAGTGAVYDIVKSIGGPLWGPANYTGVIAGTGQPIDLVVANFNNDGQAYGEVGYYYSLNNFVNKGSGITAFSNQDLSLYLDSETLYLGGAAGLKAMKTVMAHESQHMQSFYRRAMLLGPQYVYDTWLEEMAAMMMEDWASFNIDTSYNSVRDGRFQSFLTYAGQGSYSCGLDNWTPGISTCDSYTTNGSFGGFLNRQLGLAFYKSMLTDKSSTDTMTALNNVINQYRPGSSVAQEFRHFATAAESQIPLNLNIAEYSFPARVEGGFTLPSIDPSDYVRDLPTASPTTLLRLASFPAVRLNSLNTYQETVTLPPHTTLTVVVR